MRFIKEAVAAAVTAKAAHDSRNAPYQPSNLNGTPSEPGGYAGFAEDASSTGDDESE